MALNRPQGNQMIVNLLAPLGYRADTPLRFLNKRLCGLWLIWIGLVIMLGTQVGGAYAINPVIFGVGYGLGMAVIFNNQAIARRFSFGPSSPFQAKMTNLAFVLMFVLMGLFAGCYFATLDFRMIWLGALLATAIHFMPFAAVHGMALIWLSIPLIVNAGAGMLLPEMPFYFFGMLDGAIKVLFGVALLLSPKPVHSEG